MTKLASDPQYEQLLQLVQILYGSQSRFLWTDAGGVTQETLESEGG